MVMYSVCLLCTSMVSGLSSCVISAGGPSVASTSTLVLVYWGREGGSEGWRDRDKILFEMVLTNWNTAYCHGNLMGVGDTSTTECLP